MVESAAAGASFGEDWNAPDDPMWYLPTGAAFIQNMGDNHAVAMTAEGINIGGSDLLNFLAGDIPLNSNGDGFGAQL